MSDLPAATEAATERQTPSLTVRQKILVAGAELAREGDGTFPGGELVVRAWKLYPESFSLQGTEHPDSNAVIAKLSGPDGLCGLGWFERVGPRRYALTRRGRKEAEKLLPKPPRAPRPPARAILVVPTPAPPPISLADAAAVRCAVDLAQCEALRKFLRGSPLTLTDAKRFWGIVFDKEAEKRLAETEKHLRRAVESFSTDRPGLPGLPSLSTCFGLLNLHRIMRGRFGAGLGAP